jgi:hypothetical protein
MSMCKSIQLLTDAKAQTKRSDKTGRDYSYTELQGLIHYEDGRAEVFVSRMFPERGEKARDFAAGHYMPVMQLRPDMQSRDLKANIVSLTPINEASGALKRAA